MDHFKKSAHFDVVNMEISSRVYFAAVASSADQAGR